jgi:hypothetical protein
MIKKSKLRFNLKKEINKTFKITFMKLKDLVNASVPMIDLKTGKPEEKSPFVVLTESNIPFVIKYKLSVFSKKVQPELDAYNEKRTELVKKFGTPKLGEDGKETDQFTFDIEKGKEFTIELEKIVNQDITVDIPEIKIIDLGNPNIDFKYINALSWLFKE